MSYAADVIEGYKQASDKGNEPENKEEIIIVEENQQSNELPKSSEPFESFVATLAETIKKQKESKKITEISSSNEQKENNIISENQEVVLDTTPKTEEPFESFVATLAQSLKQEKNKKKNSQSITSELNFSNKIKLKEKTEEFELSDNSETNTNENKPSSFISKYTQELAKDSKNEIKSPEEDVKIKSIVSEQINRVRQLYPNLGMSSSGGGTNAVQYANGGTMNGDLNVLGRYLSGGVDLAQIFSGSGVGFSDRLISDSQTLILSSNGSLIFQTTNGDAVLSNTNNTFNVKSLNTTETLLSAGLNLSDLFLPKQEFIVDGGSY